MDEAAIAGVDAHVVDPAAKVQMQPEEHEVTGLQCIERYRLCGALLLIGRTWYVDSDPTMHIDHESAAVEPANVAAEVIAGSDERGSGTRNAVTPISSMLGRGGNAGAACDERQRQQRNGAPENRDCSFPRADSGALSCA